MASVAAIVLEHPDERPAGEDPSNLLRLLRKKRNASVSRVIGNPAAVAAFGLRFVKENIIFAKPDPEGNTEQRRKAELGEIIAKHALAISWHGIKQPDADFAACHPEADPIVWYTLALSGVRRVVHPLWPFHTAKLHQNYALLEASPNSDLTSTRLHEIIEQVAAMDVVPPGYTARTFEGERYAYAKEITAAQAQDWGLPPEMKPFVDEFSPEVAARLGYPGIRVTPMNASWDLYARRTGIYAECAIPWAAAEKML